MIHSVRNGLEFIHQRLIEADIEARFEAERIVYEHPMLACRVFIREYTPDRGIGTAVTKGMELGCEDDFHSAILYRSHIPQTLFKFFMEFIQNFPFAQGPISSTTDVSMFTFCEYLLTKTTTIGQFEWLLGRLVMRTMEMADLEGESRFGVIRHLGSHHGYSPADMDAMIARLRKNWKVVQELE